ncbi:MAG: 4Fe-4S binding protein [Peptococcaceae bacterium]|nr:4Fe-4S binding protein [Peptococcaceae bacterium]
MTGTMPAPRSRRIVVNKKWCKGCGICAALCPRGALAMDGTGKAAALNHSLCTGCGTCQSHCPDFAIWIEVG